MSLPVVLAGGDSGPLDDKQLNVLALIALFVILITIVIETVTHRLEHALERHQHLSKLLGRLYREAMIVGLVASGIFATDASFSLDKDVKHALEVVHFTLFLLMVLQIVLNLLLMWVSVRISRDWDRLEAMEAQEYLDIQARRLRLRDKLRRMSLMKRLFAVQTRRDYDKALQQWRYHDLRLHFIAANHLPPQFSFATYLRKCKQHVFIELIDLHWMGFVVLAMALLFELAVRNGSGTGEPHDIEWQLKMSGFACLITIVCVASYVKVSGIYRRVLHSSLIDFDPTAGAQLLLRRRDSWDGSELVEQSNSELPIAGLDEAALDGVLPPTDDSSPTGHSDHTAENVSSGSNWKNSHLAALKRLRLFTSGKSPQASSKTQVPPRPQQPAHVSTDSAAARTRRRRRSSVQMPAIVARERQKSVSSPGLSYAIPDAGVSAQDMLDIMLHERQGTADPLAVRHRRRSLSMSPTEAARIAHPRPRRMSATSLSPALSQRVIDASARGTDGPAVVNDGSTGSINGSVNNGSDDGSTEERIVLRRPSVSAPSTPLSKPSSPSPSVPPSQDVRRMRSDLAIVHEDSDAESDHSDQGDHSVTEHVNVHRSVKRRLSLDDDFNMIRSLSTQSLGRRRRRRRSVILSRKGPTKEADDGSLSEDSEASENGAEHRPQQREQSAFSLGGRQMSSRHGFRRQSVSHSQVFDREHNGPVESPSEAVSESGDDEGQLDLFWFGSHKFLLHTVQMCMFLLSALIAVALQLPDTLFKTWWSCLAVLLPLPVVMYVVPRIIPLYTVIIHVGQLTDLNIVQEALIKALRQAAREEQLKKEQRALIESGVDTHEGSHLHGEVDVRHRKTVRDMGVDNAGRHFGDSQGQGGHFEQRQLRSVAEKKLSRGLVWKRRLGRALFSRDLMRFNAWTVVVVTAVVAFAYVPETTSFLSDVGRKILLCTLTGMAALEQVLLRPFALDWQWSWWRRYWRTAGVDLALCVLAATGAVLYASNVVEDPAVILPLLPRVLVVFPSYRNGRRVLRHLMRQDRASRVLEIKGAGGESLTVPVDIPYCLPLLSPSHR
ncbi:MAG: hypothetical protein MHM6MM_005785 [Cercozoa sp. M6MM]